MPDYKFVLDETLDDAFLRAEADDEVRVVILGGTGKMFSSGHDTGSPPQECRSFARRGG